MKTNQLLFAVSVFLGFSSSVHAQTNIDATAKYSWSENCGWMNWHDAGSPAGQQGAVVGTAHGFLSGFVWCESTGWINLGNGSGPYLNTTGANSGVNVDPLSGDLTGMAWGENVGWVNFAGGAAASPPRDCRFDFGAARLRGFAWCENVGWVNLDDSTDFVAIDGRCGSADFNHDGDSATDADIEAFFACLAGSCCATCESADFNGDGDSATDADIEAFFRVLAGGNC